MKGTHTIKLSKIATPITFRLEQLLARDWTLVGLLVLLGLISRIPFRSEILYHWDSVNFAYAIREFNVAKEQPHPPGYIVYVWLSRLVDAVLHDAQTTLASISLVASVLAVVALFYLGRAMFDRRTGLVAALFLATSPLFWFYSEIALPHTLDTLLVIVSVWWLYETMQGHQRYLYPAVIVLAIAGGVRQQTLVFLAPLLLFALRRVGWKRFLTAGVLGVVICLAWFIPLIILNAGFSNYMRVMGEFGNHFQSSTSVFVGAGWWGIRRNVIKLTLYTLYGWSLAILPAIIYVIARIRRLEWPRHWEKAIFLLLWIGPTLGFYTFIHMGQQGLVFVFLPALLLLSAVGLTRLLATQSRRLIATAALVALNIGIFCLGPEYPLGPGTQRLLTRATIVNSDHYYQARLEAIENNFAPESTAILAANWHHVEYYLPEYTELPFGIGSKWEKNAGIPSNDSRVAFTATPAELGLQLTATGQAAIIIFDPILADFNRTPELGQTLSLPNGDRLEYLELGPDDQLYLNPNSFGLLFE